MAALIDLAILVALMVFVGMLAFGGLLFASLQLPTMDLASGDVDIAGIAANLVGFTAYILSVFLAFDGYFIFFEWKKGATPGKTAMGLRVVSLRGGKLTFGQCVIREIFRQLDNALFFVPLIAIFFSPRRQRLGDMAAKTLVVLATSPEPRSVGA